MRQIITEKKCLYIIKYKALLTSKTSPPKDSCTSEWVLGSDEKKVVHSRHKKNSRKFDTGKMILDYVMRKFIFQHY